MNRLERRALVAPVRQEESDSSPLSRVLGNRSWLLGWWHPRIAYSLTGLRLSALPFRHFLAAAAAAANAILLDNNDRHAVAMKRRREGYESELYGEEERVPRFPYRRAATRGGERSGNRQRRLGCRDLWPAPP